VFLLLRRHGFCYDGEKGVVLINLVSRLSVDYLFKAGNPSVRRS
jgi:hypothetical protein